MSDWRLVRAGALLGMVISSTSLIYKDGPPVGHTGGFSEPTCHSCHFEGPLNSDEASAEIADLPQTFLPDSMYVFRIAVARADLGAAGFSMSTRFGDGSQAGEISAFDERATVRSDSNGILFAMHTLAGSLPATNDSTSWLLRWVAPTRSDSIYVHLAANAANGDDSRFGDLIETRSFTISPGS